jgi:hypothetical protein
LVNQAQPKPQQGLVIFDFFPRIKALGQATIQKLCNEWTGTPDAVYFDIAGIDVGDESASFALALRQGGRRNTPLGEEFYAFLKSLLDYIIDHSLSGEDQVICRLHTAGLVRTPPPVRFPKSMPFPPKKPTPTAG